MSQKLIDALDHHFEKHRLIFWYDEDAQQRGLFESYHNPKIEKLEIENNEFWIKYHVLREKPEANFLIYSPHARPRDEKNWLLDLNLAHYIYATDETSLYLQELDVPNHFEHFVSEHAPFFRNRNDRLDPFKKQIEDHETERSLSYAMLSVLTGRTAAQKSIRKDLRELLLPLIIDTMQGEGELYGHIDKHKLTDFFWSEVRDRFGYETEEPTIQGFLLFLFQSAFRFLLGSYTSVFARESFTFLDTWRTHSDYAEHYASIATKMEEELNIAHEIQPLEMQQLVGIDLFKCVDKRILGYLTTHAAEETIETDKALSIIASRRESFWYSVAEEERLRDYYRALEAFFTYQHKKYAAEKMADVSYELWRQYVEELYELDSLHRRFLHYYQETTADQNFHSLLTKLEKHYINSFQFELHRRWEKTFRESSYAAPRGVRRQEEFFSKFAAPYLREDRVLFVIISDALRYDAGVELFQRLMRTNRFQVKIDAMSGSIPSYTQLGMASLLPHTSLEIESNTGNVLVDGQKSSGVTAREAILRGAVAERYPGKKAKAMQATDFNHLSLEQQEQEIEGIDLFYLYHNHIDAIGDNAKTESGLPGAVDEEVDFLHNLCRKVANLNRTHMIVTSDHGFLYQQSGIDDSDIISVKEMPGEYRRNRRFILGSGLPKKSALTHISGKDVSLQDGLDILVPQGPGRISIKGGGRRFVHGGISLQEICIPLITIRKSRSDDVAAVDIEVLKKGEQITTGQVSIKFFQSQPVGPKVESRRLLMRFESDDGSVISNSVEAIFDISDSYEQNRSKLYQFTFTREAEKYNNSYIKLMMYDKKEGGTLVYYNEYSYTYRTTVEKDFDI